MARPIDEKIVAMKMDISDFKRKALETTGIFGKLKDSLSRVSNITGFSKIADSFRGIQSAAQKVDMSSLGSAVDNVAGRFGSLEVIATTALATITNKAVNAGVQMAKSLGIDQIASGFSEYELKIGSIGTVLSNTEWNGTGLADVNKALAELNEYSDQTIYNFAQMSQNVGRFTAAGVTLGDSTVAIKGLGNLAAISGSTTDQMNTAMYQMSQAMAAGKLNLMDWNSMTNAGMGGKKTQDALLATAKSMGIAVDTTDGFRNSIEQGWLTSEVFLATLKQFGEDESMTEAATKVRTFTQMIDTLKEGIGSGWATSWEIIFGDFEEATKLWTGVSDFFGGFFSKQADARNKLLKGIFDGGIMTSIFSSLKNIASPLVQIFGAIGAGFKMAFPPIGVKAILDIAKGFMNLTSGLKLSEKSVENIKTIFAGLFSVLAIGWNVIKGAVSVIIALIPSFDGLGAKVLELLAKVAGIPIAFNNATDSGEAFAGAMKVLKTIASGIAKGLEFIIDGLIIFVGAVATAWGILSKGDFSGGPWEEDSKIVDKLFTIRDTVVEVADNIQEAWTILTTGKLNSGGPWDRDSKVVEWLLKIRDALKDFGSAIGSINWSAIGAGFVDFFRTIKDGFDWMADKLSTLGETIKNAMPSGDQMLGGGTIIAMVTVVGIVLKKMYDIFTGWGKIGEGLVEVLEGAGGALEAFGLQVKAQALVTIAIGVGILAAAFWLMAGLKVEDITRGLYAMVGSLTAVVLAMHIMTKYDITGTGMKAAVQVVALAIAVSILAGAIKKVSGLSWEQISKGLVGMMGIMGVFSLAVIAMSKFGGAKVSATALQFLALAVSMHILFSVVKKLGEVDVDVLVQGLKALGIILLELGLFLALAGASKFGASSALGILGVAAAIMIMVPSIKRLGEMDVDVLKQGLTTIGYILLAIALFAAITGTVGLLSASVGLVLVAGALTLLMIPIATLGNMDLKTLAKGLGAIAAALVIIGLASMLMGGVLAAGAGLIVMAIGLNMLLIPIAALGAMSWETLIKGIVGLGLGLLVIGGAAALLGMVAPLILAFAVALLVLGVGMLAAGLGMSLMATGLVTFAALTGTAVITIVSMLGTLIAGLVSLIPMAVDFIVKIAHKMADALVENSPVLYQKFLTMILGMLTVLEENLPKFITAASNIIIGFIDGMEQEIPRIGESIARLMDTMATTVETNAPIVLNAFLRMMSEVTVIMIKAGVATIDALFGWIPGVSAITSTIGETAESNIRESFGAQMVATNKGDEFANSLAAKTGAAKTAGAKVGVGAETGADSADLLSIGGGHGTDFANSLSGKSLSALKSGTTVANSAETGADTANLTSIGSGHGSDFASGISSRISAATSSGRSIASGGITGANQVSMTSTGTQFGNGFAGGIGGSIDKVVSAAKSLASRAKNTIADWLGIASPSRVMRKDGGWFGTGFALGISDKANMVAENAKSLALTARDSLNQFVEGFELPVEDNELHFKAVVDYDSIDTNRFGKLTPIRPDTSFTNGMIASTKLDRRTNVVREQPIVSKEPNNTEDVIAKQPAVIQVVTPEKRELARWLVDDITDFQDFKMATNAQF